MSVVTPNLGVRQPFNLVPLADDLMARYEREGLLVGQSLSRVFSRTANSWPWLPAVTEGSVRLSYGVTYDLVRRVAAYLRNEGVRPGDVVAWQMPNWWESYVTAIAIWQLGAVSAPIAPIYREHELGQIIEQLQPAAVIAAGPHRSSNNAEVLADVLGSLNLTRTARIVVRGHQAGWADFDTVLTHPGQQVPIDTHGETAAAVLYTSGTSSAPKGVILTARALLADCACVIRTWGLGWDDVGYMPATMGHVTGLLLGVLTPAMAGASMVLADGWDPNRAVNHIVRENVTFSGGATIFLRELTEAAQNAGHRLGVKHYCCGGAAVHPDVMKAAEDIGVPAFRAYGMTENSSVTFGNNSFTFEQRSTTDGPVAQGVDVKIVDYTGTTQSPGTEGEILVRGPERMSGYVDSAANKDALDEEGWFHTGDLGILTEDGFLTVTGRLKEIINRGGEKFSALEIEEILRSDPAVKDVAVVAAPDSRLGEVPAAFLVTEPGADLAAIADRFRGTGVAPQKIPVVWHQLDELPTTASGKVKKSELVDELGQISRQP